MIKNKTLSIIIPVFNEAKYIEEVIKKVSIAKCCGLTKEIIIVDDGSIDDTNRILNKIINKNHFGKIKLVRKVKNQGKGSAIIEGLKNVTGDIVLIQDADLEYDPKEYPRLLYPILKNSAYAVYGSRTLGIGEFGNKYSSPFFYLGGRFLTEFINLFYGLSLTDQPTGYKLFRSEFIPIIFSGFRQKDFSFEVEISILLAKNRKNIIEVPISYKPRSVSEGKKISIYDFIKSLVIAVMYKFK